MGRRAAFGAQGGANSPSCRAIRKAGPFVIRLMLPAGYKLPPHWHAQEESLTVISGTCYFRTGD
jgi:quercetin dioxygenase-like cupin family protein